MGKILTKRQRFWLTHVRTAMSSGMPLQEYAKRHRLSVGALYNAKSVLKRGGALVGTQTQPVPDAFVAVRIAERSAEPIRCRLQHAHGWQLEMERLPDPQWLLALMQGGDVAP
jgi:hypothetical protein